MELPTTIVHAVLDTAARLGDRPALWTWQEGVFLPTSWREYARRIQHFALGLHKLGFERGDVLALFGSSREEWLVAQMGAMALGGMAVGVHPAAGPAQVEHILAHSEATMALVETSPHVQQLQELRSRLPRLERLLVMERQPAAEAATYSALLASGAAANDSLLWQELSQLRSDSLAMLAYTWEGGDNPRAVTLSHRNIVWSTAQLLEATHMRREHEVLLSYMPLARVSEQVSIAFGPALAGYQVYFAQSQAQWESSLREVRPTAFVAVPRTWEHFRGRIEARVQRLPWHRRKVVDWARSVATRRNQYLLSGDRAPIDLEAQFEAANRLVLAPFKEQLGLGRARFLVASAASIDRELLRFFASFDLVIREAYGQTECTGAISLNTLEATRLGTVGQPLPGVEVRISEEGEICVRGPNVSPGYFKDPARTAQVLSEGWLRTGDLGEFDDEGYLRLVGRRWEFLVTASGGKVAPAAIERMLVNIKPVGNALVVGEGRDYLVALLALDELSVPGFARAHQWPESPADLAGDPRFLAYLQNELNDTVNAQLGPGERVVRFAVLSRPFTMETGELGPDLAVRRRECERKHQQLIDSLYSSPNGLTSVGLEDHLN